MSEAIMKDGSRVDLDVMFSSIRAMSGDDRVRWLYMISARVIPASPVSHALGRRIAGKYVDCGRVKRALAQARARKAMRRGSETEQEVAWLEARAAANVAEALHAVVDALDETHVARLAEMAASRIAETAAAKASMIHAVGEPTWLAAWLAAWDAERRAQLADCLTILEGTR